MVVSFHPCIVADHNRLCAGRAPDGDDQKWIQQAAAVILPQGCPPPLWRLATRHCRYVFPNYQARFAYPGKLGQIKLFRQLRAPHPPTALFPGVDAFHSRYATTQLPDGFAFPVIFKFDWGGEGDTVARLETPAQLADMLDQAQRFEAGGQRGFLLQPYIEHNQRSLRVVIMGTDCYVYWRIQTQPHVFGTSVKSGAQIDNRVDDDLARIGRSVTMDLCKQSGIDLAGIDLIFDSRSRAPFLLEINYFFGRRGLGGSHRYYRLLEQAIERWLRQNHIESDALHID